MAADESQPRRGLTGDDAGGPGVSRLPGSGTLGRYIGAVAQLVAHLHGMQGVRGSSPLSSTTRVTVAAPVPGAWCSDCQCNSDWARRWA